MVISSAREPVWLAPERSDRDDTFRGPVDLRETEELIIRPESISTLKWTDCLSGPCCIMVAFGLIALMTLTASLVESTITMQLICWLS
jgi:hypothetical protein